MSGNVHVFINLETRHLNIPKKVFLFKTFIPTKITDFTVHVYLNENKQIIKLNLREKMKIYQTATDSWQQIDQIKVHIKNSRIIIYQTIPLHFHIYNNSKSQTENWYYSNCPRMAEASHKSKLENHKKIKKNIAQKL